MRGSELLEKMELVDPAFVEAADAVPAQRNIGWRNWLAAAACVVLVAASAVTMGRLTEEPVTPIQPNSIAATSPNGVRKYLNYNGCRYVFLNSGSAYDLTQQQLGDALGTIVYDIQAAPKENGKLDFAATFALGGTVYQLRTYDPAFRIAVKLDGNYYIAENVDTVDGSDVDMAAYFETADFEKTVKEIQIYDHFGREKLETVKGSKVSKMIALLSQVHPAELSNEDFERIGKAQKNGKSFLVVFRLADTTQFQLYVIPSMSIAMIGDNRYRLPEAFQNDFGTLFGSLKQSVTQPHA